MASAVSPWTLQYNEAILSNTQDVAFCKSKQKPFHSKYNQISSRVRRVMHTALTCESANTILKRNKIRSCNTVYQTLQGGSNFCVHG